jgi:fructose-specific phosphotransferase system IIC component
MRYAYEALLRLYPSGYRLAFAQEMTSVFEQAAGDCQPRGFLAYVGFLGAEFLGLLAGAFSMWTDEYMERSRRRVSASFLISLLAGAAITVFFQGSFYSGVIQPRRIPVQTSEVPPITSDLMLPLVLAGGILLFLSVFCAAFVWNMRMIGNRSGRLKPIWMPGRAVNPRPARRAARSRVRHR